MNDLARHRTGRKFIADGFTFGDPHGFIGPLKPPSVWHDKPRGDTWNTDFLMASAYTWGRMDAGEQRDVNANYRFMNAWADARWEYECHYRSHMPAMYSAIDMFDRGERF